MEQSNTRATSHLHKPHLLSAELGEGECSPFVVPPTLHKGNFQENIEKRRSSYETSTPFLEGYGNGKGGLPPWWVLVVTYSFGIGLSAQAMLVYSLLMPAQVATLTSDDEKGRYLGFLMLSGSWISILGPPLFGVYSDRFRSRWGRRRPFFLVGGTIASGGMMLMGLSRSFAALTFSYLVMQLGTILVVTAFNATVPDTVSKANLGTAAGVLGAISVVGFGIGAGLGAVIDKVGYPQAYATAAGVVFFFMIISTTTFVEPSSVDMKFPPLTIREFGGKLIAPFRLRNFRWVFGTRLLIQFGVYTVQEFLEYWVQDVLKVDGMSPTTTTAILCVPVGICSMFSAVVVGIYSDHIGQRMPFLFWSALLMAGFVAAAAFVSTFNLALVICAFFGLATGVFLALDYAVVCDVLDEHEGGNAANLGLWHVSIVLPQLIAAPVAGAILSSFQTSSSGPTTAHLGLNVDHDNDATTWLDPSSGVGSAVDAGIGNAIGGAVHGESMASDSGVGSGPLQLGGDGGTMSASALGYTVIFLLTAFYFLLAAVGFRWGLKGIR